MNMKMKMKMNNLYKLILPMTIILILSISCIASNNPINFNISLYQPNVDTYQTKDITKDAYILNFWFPSCPPCVAEMPQLNKFYLEHKNEVDVVAVQLIGLDSMEDGQNFVNEKSIDFAVGPDTTGKVSVDYQISVYPTTIFVDSKGNIADYWQGEINAEELKQKLTNIQKSED